MFGLQKLLARLKGASAAGGNVQADSLGVYAMVRYCARCDQEVVPIPEASKEWTTGTSQGAFKHKAASENGVQNCGRTQLNESDTYTERDSGSDSE
jgi:hypothetical protein